MAVEPHQTGLVEIGSPETPSLPSVRLQLAKKRKSNEIQKVEVKNQPLLSEGQLL